MRQAESFNWLRSNIGRGFARGFYVRCAPHRNGGARGRVYWVEGEWRGKITAWVSSYTRSIRC
jgi:hypothetical protein